MKTKTTEIPTIAEKPASMRAKMRVTKVEPNEGGEVLHFTAVSREDSYPADGSDENNTYAKFTPDGSVRLNVQNPALKGKFPVGSAFYVDFLPVVGGGTYFPKPGAPTE